MYTHGTGIPLHDIAITTLKDHSLDYTHKHTLMTDNRKKERELLRWECDAVTVNNKEGKRMQHH